jgi:hypothetical protein
MLAVRRIAEDLTLQIHLQILHTLYTQSTTQNIHEHTQKKSNLNLGDHRSKPPFDSYCPRELALQGVGMRGYMTPPPHTHTHNKIVLRLVDPKSDNQRKFT